MTGHYPYHTPHCHTATPTTRWKVVPRAPRDLPPGPDFYWCFRRARSLFDSILGPRMNFRSSQGRFSQFFIKNIRPVLSQGPLPTLVQCRAGDLGYRPPGTSPSRSFEMADDVHRRARCLLLGESQFCQSRFHGTWEHAPRGNMELGNTHRVEIQMLPSKRGRI